VNLQIGASSGDGHSVDLADFTSLSALNTAGIGSRSDALSALDAIDSSLASIDETRVKWGASMNRLVHAGDVSSSVSLNLDASRSQIIDTDYAKATADLAKAQILQMAGKAMLSQANQAPISVLRLLR
jgi:flagellin